MLYFLLYFIEDETKIKELMSKLAAMKETMYMETQTLEHKSKELSKEKVYSVSVIYFYFFPYSLDILLL